MRPVASITLCLLTVFIWRGGLVAGPASTPPEDSARAVVLRNGNVLVGTVTLVSDGYNVAREGAVLHAPQSMVDYVADTLVDVYEQKRSRIDVVSARDHLMLARWCMRYELWPQAAREIVDARGLDPNLVGLQFVETQLAARSSARNESSDDLWPSATPEAPTFAARDEAIEQVSERLPPSVIVQFVRRVQPVLVNNCTAVGCHRVDGPSSFQLNRALLYSETNRHTTWQNLLATLEQVDRTQPQASPLLHMSIRAHGGDEQAPLAEHRRELYQQLAQWVEQVAFDEAASTAPIPPANAVVSPTARRLDHSGVKRGAFGANHPRAQGRHGSPNVKFGLRLRKVEEPEPQASED
jgi:hypothetical protein